MRTSVFFSLFFLVFSAMQAQQDSLQQEILDYSNTTSQIISRGRSLLLDKFMERDLQKVSEVRDYLVNEVQNDDYLALYPSEYWLLLYWTTDYEELLHSITSFDDEDWEKMSRQIPPTYDRLFAKLRESTLNSVDQIKNRLRAADLKTVDQDFLLLYLEYLLTNSEEVLQEQKRINLLADEFLANHPDSAYENYVRENIRYVFIPSKWGFGFEFFSGYGLFTGNLSEDYQNSIPMGVGFDIEYSKITLYLRNYIGFSFTKKELPSDTKIWKENSQVRVLLPEASFGYAIIDNNRLKVSPFAGIASTSISPTEYDIEKQPEIEDAGHDFTTTYTAGINADFKLNWGTGLFRLTDSKHSYWFVRLRYGFSAPQFRDGYSGNMHYLTLGLGGLGRGSKRQL
ncbi:hypothetical protein V5739_03085 [Salinimicrobium sp. TIG7-5_MAKvit]|uniref:hypothetical protein n=1 Tax=Salinimicrobium sp. TIG7-5_MAKvit TaxID=3121289 RepID=UPI003C6E8B43